MDPKFIEKAKSELREDDARKTQSLELFRDWLSKHPFLKGVRQDDKYLLQFLRVRKFNMDGAYQTIERNYLSRKRFSNILETTKEDDLRMLKLLDAGYVVPFSERDERGQKIVLLLSEKLDLDIYTVHDALRLMIYATKVLLEEEETQIAGIVFINDFSNASLKHILNPVDARDIVEFLGNCATHRQKMYYFLNLPSFAGIALDLLRPVLGEKQGKRFEFVKTSGELKNVIDLALLPKEYGGTKTINEMLDDFKQLHAKSREDLMKVSDFKVDYEKVPAEKFCYKDEDNVGSFRKLEVD